MITLMWVGLGIFTLLVVAAIGVCIWALVRERRQERAEDAGLIVNAATLDIDMTPPAELAYFTAPLAEAPTREVVQGRAVGVRATDSPPAARADLTGSLTSRSYEEDPGFPARGEPGQSSPAQPPPATPPRRAIGPGTAAAAPKTPVKAPPLPRLLPPAAAAIGALRVLTAPHRAAQARAFQAEVMSVFPPDRPWPGDDTLTRMTAIKGDQ